MDVQRQGLLDLGVVEQVAATLRRNLGMVRQHDRRTEHGVVIGRREHGERVDALAPALERRDEAMSFEPKSALDLIESAIRGLRSRQSTLERKMASISSELSLIEKLAEMILASKQTQMAAEAAAIQMLETIERRRKKLKAERKPDISEASMSKLIQ